MGWCLIRGVMNDKIKQEFSSAFVVIRRERRISYGQSRIRLSGTSFAISGYGQGTGGGISAPGKRFQRGPPSLWPLAFSEVFLRDPRKPPADGPYATLRFYPPPWPASAAGRA